MKSKAFLLFIIGISSTLLVVYLYWLSINKVVSNGFDRSIVIDIELLATLDVKYSGYYFAGSNNGKCYLGNSRSPFHLLEIDDTVQRKKFLKYSSQSQPVAGKIAIDSPYFYLTDQVSHNIFRGKVETLTIGELIHQGKFFAESIPVGPSSNVFRSLYKDKMQYLLFKENSDPASHFDAPALLQKQIDGLFCTDGMLQFDKEEKLIFYTYFYRNQFICIDTALTLRYRGKTIDTMSVADIKVSKITSKGEITLASPPSIVNRRSFASDGRLFINSNLIADNENPKVFNSADVIDIYNSLSGDYQGSFYLPKINGIRMRHFAIFDNKLYSLHDQFLAVYSLTLN